MSLIAVAEILMDVEYELRRLELWEHKSPHPDALASTQPFAVDTLTFPQWLQFIFIPRLQAMIESRQPLPANSGVAPMAEVYFQPLTLDADILVNYLRRIDRLLSESSD